MSQALLGFKKVFTNLDGEGIEVENNTETTQHGQQIRVKGKGFPDKRYGSRGDLVVTCQIDMPRHLSSVQLQGEIGLLQNLRNYSKSRTFLIKI